MLVTAQIEGVNLEKLLLSAQQHGIVIKEARRIAPRTMHVSMQSGERAALASLCAKSGWNMREIRADCSVRALLFLGRRRWLPVSFVLFLLLVWLSSQMILRIQIEHAQEHVAEVRRFLLQQDVRPGRMKRMFSTDDLRARLALCVPGLAFTSFRYAGSTLVVDCRPSTQAENWGVTGDGMDIVAAQSGIITRILASSGTPVVSPGQAVHRGQVLIRGEERMEKGGMRAVRAQGEVLARVFSVGEARVKMTKERTVETGQTRTKTTLRTPWHARVLEEEAPFSSCDESVQEQVVVGLYLPLWRERTTYAETAVFEEPRSRGDAASMAQGAAEEIAKKGCPYGAEILDKTVDYSMIDNEFLYAAVVLEYEASIAGRMQ